MAARSRKQKQRGSHGWRGVQGLCISGKLRVYNLSGRACLASNPVLSVICYLSPFRYLLKATCGNTIVTRSTTVEVTPGTGWLARRRLRLRVRACVRACVCVCVHGRVHHTVGKPWLPDSSLAFILVFAPPHAAAAPCGTCGASLTTPRAHLAGSRSRAPLDC
jgi:hypothetical protein